MHGTTIDYDDATGLPTKFRDTIGTLATFTSSEHGLPLTVTDVAGNTTYLGYDQFGNLTWRLDRLGRRTSYVYDGIGRRTSMIDPRGAATTTTYFARGPVFQIIDALGFARTFFYDEDENVVNETDAEPHFSTFRRYTFDVLNHLTDVRHEDDKHTKYTRDFRGNPLTETDEQGRVTHYDYDLAGQLLKTTYPDGKFTLRSYDLIGRLESTTDERNHETSYEYEPGCGCSERLTRITAPLNRVTMMEYDGAGRKTAVTDPAGHRTEYSYDDRGHLTDTLYVGGTTVHDDYDTRGRRTATTDQTGKVTHFGYDDEGQLASVTDPLNHVTSYAYDAAGNLATVTDANTHVTSYEYDLLGRKTKRTLPLGMSETFAYTMRPVVNAHTDFRGKTTTMTYDMRARLLTRVPDPSLGEPNESYTYYDAGARHTMTDASGTTTYTSYDARDRLLTKATPAGTLTYTYDDAGNVATVRSSNTNGTSVDYAWDAANRLASVTDNRQGGSGMTTPAFTATDQPDTVSYSNGVKGTYAYDNLNRVLSLAWQHGTSSFASSSYTYNDRGQRLSATAANGRAAAYAYDGAARLTSETITGDPRGGTWDGELGYALDNVGNRLSRSAAAGLAAQSFTYDANDEISGDTYDPNGNLTSSDGNTYTYDFRDRLKTKNGGAVTLVYDCDGNRAAKTVGGVTTKYLVDDLSPTGYVQVLEEVASGGVQARYTYGTSIVSQTRFPGGTATTSFYGYDAHGNVTFLTDANGTVTDAYDYDAWGTLVGSTGTTVNAKLYVGEELDTDLGLVNLRARQYKPGTGRFLTIDPAPGALYAPLSFNRYLYGGADPVDRLDPLGLLYQERAKGTTAGEYAMLLAAVSLPLAAGVGIAYLGRNGQYVAVREGTAFRAGDTTVCRFAMAITYSPDMSLPERYRFCPMPEKGDCPEELRYEFHQAIKEFCKTPPSSCKSAKTCTEVEAIIDKTLRCVYARQRMNEQCFPNSSDSGHGESDVGAIGQTYNRLTGCETRKKELQCP